MSTEATAQDLPAEPYIPSRLFRVDTEAAWIPIGADLVFTRNQELHVAITPRGKEDLHEDVAVFAPGQWLSVYELQPDEDTPHAELEPATTYDWPQS